MEIKLQQKIGREILGQEEDYEMLVTPDQASQYLRSSSSKLAIKLFEIFELDSRSVTQMEYCLMHDHLFVLIHFSNGHRSAVSANMTVNEFLQYKKIDGVYQIRVVNHKNFHVSGPAVVSLQPKELNWLHIYFTKIRPQVNPKCDNVMLSWTGNFMRSGAISKQLHSL